MSLNSNFDRVRQLFAEQFSSDSRGFIYRKRQTGAPIRISEKERDAFVATFNSRIRYIVWSIIAATIGLIALMTWLTPDVDSTSGQVSVWAGLLAILIPSMVVYHWAWNAPARELKRRTPEGLGLTKEEARALAFSKVTYRQLMLPGLMGVGLVWKNSAKTDVFHGWGIFWLILGAALVALSGLQAIRKWLLSQR